MNVISRGERGTEKNGAGGGGENKRTGGGGN